MLRHKLCQNCHKVEISIGPCKKLQILRKFEGPRARNIASIAQKLKKVASASRFFWLSAHLDASDVSKFRNGSNKS